MVIPNSFFFSFFKGIAILNSIQSIFTSLSLSLSLSCTCTCTCTHKHTKTKQNVQCQITRHGKTGWSGRVRVRSNGLWVKTGHFKRIKKSGCGSGRVDSYFSHDFFIYKENSMYLPFEKPCNKLLNVKYITLNSPLISRMNSVKLINTYSIILKLYKS